ncbi:MAG: lipase/esterase [Marmoricola sp.]|nr:lipase/esterase [Marmoricola sp.]
MTARLGRRSVLAGAATILLAACGAKTAAKTGAPSTKGDGLRQIRYAEDHPDQYGVLGLPSGAGADAPKALVVLLHGGYWQAGYGAGLMDGLAADLRKRGYATWNVEYRRVGTGGGFPATFLDVAAAIDHVPTLGLPGSLPVVVIGHSAGGQLAAWAASRNARTPGGTPRITAGRTISLSGVLELTDAWSENLGTGAVQSLMGGSPTQLHSAYAVADPGLLLPARGTFTAIHARDDTIVPISQSKAYAAADQTAGGTAAFTLVPGGHFDLIDPSSAAWHTTLTYLPD